MFVRKLSQSWDLLKGLLRRALDRDEWQHGWQRIRTRLSALVLRPKSLALIEAIFIGVVCGLASVLLKQGVGWLGSFRVAAADRIPTLILLPCVGLVGGYFAGLLVQQFAPDAMGSGIPQVKAALEGFAVPLNLRLAAVKGAATVLSLASGLTLGRQGPTVQIGASLAAWFARWVPTSPEYRKQTIAAGAAAGLAAGFNAPIAGVLFAVEELLHDASTFSLGSAILASFVGAVVSRLLGERGLDLTQDIMASQASFSALEIPFFLILGIYSGLLGTAFKEGILRGTILSRRLLRWSLPRRIAVSGLICGTVVALLPEYFRNYTGLRELLGTGSLNPMTAAIAFCTHFCLTIVAASSGAPGGLFAPSLILGASLGSVVGGWQMVLLGASTKTTYVLAGMGGFFSAVARVPITAIVIVFEMTADFNLVLPLMMVSVVAYAVGEWTSRGSISESLMELKGYKAQRNVSAKNFLEDLRADQVMVSKVETLEANACLDEVKRKFARFSYRGFPVVEDGRLVGIVTQEDMARTTRRQISERTPLWKIMTPQPIAVAPNDSLSSVMYAIERYKLQRVPVVEGPKLVGIITQGDIIRAELEYLTGEEHQQTIEEAPSYTIYQRRSPATGRGRIVVPVTDSPTLPALLRLVATVADTYGYEIVFLNVLQVPRTLPPAETIVDATASLHLLQKIQQRFESWSATVHAQIRVAHGKSAAILECIEEERANLLLVEWQGTSDRPEQIFSRSIDTLLQKAPCDIAVVKWARGNVKYPIFNRWLVAFGGGPNIQRALELLPAFARACRGRHATLCQVYSPERSLPDLRELEEARRQLQPHFQQTENLLVPDRSVVQGVLTAAEMKASDAIVVGASRGGLIHYAMHNSIAEQIVRTTEATAILVRGA